MELTTKRITDLNIFIPSYDGYSRKVRYDGGHYIVNRLNRYRAGIRKPKTPRDIYFDEVYPVACVKFIDSDVMAKNYIYGQMLNKFGYSEGLIDYIDRRFETKKRASYQRYKRFWNKANLNTFNYFYTQTMDSELYESPDDFIRDFKKCMSNMHTRRGWRYMFRFEKGAENGRVHVHGLIYVPGGNSMPGYCTLKRDYSRRYHRMETRNENSFFAAKFGRNDFGSVDSKIRGRTPIQYIGKYIEKTDDKMLYSRGLPTCLETDVCGDQVVSEMGVAKLNDDGTFTKDAFVKFVTWEFIKESIFFGFYRTDGLEVLPRCG